MFKVTASAKCCGVGSLVGQLRIHQGLRLATSIEMQRGIDGIEEGWQRQRFVKQNEHLRYQRTCASVNATTSKNARRRTVTMRVSVLYYVYIYIHIHIYIYIYGNPPPPKIYQIQCCYRHCWLLSPPRLSRGLLAESWIPIETD